MTLSAYNIAQNENVLQLPPPDLLSECDHLSQFLGVAGGFRDLLNLSRSVAAPSSAPPEALSVPVSDASEREEDEVEDQGPLSRGVAVDPSRTPEDSDTEESPRMARRWLKPLRSSSAATTTTVLSHNVMDVGESAKRRSVLDHLVRLRGDLLRRWVLQRCLSYFGLASLSSVGVAPTTTAAARERLRLLLFESPSSSSCSLDGLILHETSCAVVDIDRALACARDDQQRDDLLLHWFLTGDCGGPSSVAGGHQWTVHAAIALPDIAGCSTVSELICRFSDAFVRCPDAELAESS
jgi:hypothetical protein